MKPIFNFGTRLRIATTAALLLAFVLAAPVPLDAASAKAIKIGTLGPVGSTYHKILQTMGEAWKRESKGAVDLRVYAGGKAGGEAEMVGLMMEDGLQAAVLTAVGLGEIDSSARGLQTFPMGFRTLEEVDHVGEKLQPTLEGALAKKGFVVLFWTDVGWVRIFANRPVMTPDDVRKLKLFAWAGDHEQTDIVKSAGFNVVPIETADIVPSLQTGLIDAVPMPPFFALASQVDRRAPYMLKINYAPLVGACVITRKAWETIPESLRPALLAAGRIAGNETRAAGRRESEEAEVAMVKRGLKVITPTPEAIEDWRRMCEAQYPKIRGRIMPAAIFDEAMAAIREVRAKAGQ